MTIVRYLKVLPQYLDEQNLSKPEEIVPDDYFRWMFPRLVEHRLPRYQEIADRYGVVLEAERIDDIRGETEFLELICETLG